MSSVMSSYCTTSSCIDYFLTIPKGLPVPHELYGEMTLESLVDVMAAIGLDLRTERLN